MLAALPRTTNNPMLWSAADRELLKGSPARASADERAAALQSEWEALEPLIKADPSAYPPSTWTLAAFGDALAVALRCAVWLPAAGIFALIPLADQVTRRAAGPLGARKQSKSCARCRARSTLTSHVYVSTCRARARLAASFVCSADVLAAGEGPTAFMDFDAARGSVVLIADRQHNQGDLVRAPPARTSLLAQHAQFPRSLVPQRRCLLRSASSHIPQTPHPHAHTHTHTHDAPFPPAHARAPAPAPHLSGCGRGRPRPLQRGLAPHGGGG